MVVVKGYSVDAKGYMVDGLAHLGDERVVLSHQFLDGRLVPLSCVPRARSLLPLRSPPRPLSPALLHLVHFEVEIAVGVPQLRRLRQQQPDLPLVLLKHLCEFTATGCKSTRPGCKSA
eukprot:416002-Prorocentrum_minimum.AAC.1